MLPVSDQPLPYSKPKTPDILDRKHSFLASLKPYLSLHHRRTWFFLAVLLLQILLLLSAPSIPFSLSLSLSPATPRPSPAANLIPHNTNSTAVSLRDYLITESTNVTAVDTAASLDDNLIPDNTSATHLSTAASLHDNPIPENTDATHLNTAVTAAAASTDRVVDSSESCPYGKVYIYDLPPQFNTEIVKNCSGINPWISRCDALSNSGFGKSAAVGVSTIVPESVSGAWFWTDQFSLELIFHKRMLHHRCRAAEPESANAFYIPFYLGLAIEKYIFNKKSTFEERDIPCNMMLDWLSDQQFYKKSMGWDHFITLGRISWDFRRSAISDWGTSCFYKPAMRNVTRLLIEKNPWDYFDIAVPYPTGFHPASVSEVVTWQDFVRRRERRTLFSFAGATRGLFKNDFRGILLNQCYSEPGSCRVVDCGEVKCANGSSAILETFLDSDFCLQPRGDSFTRRSIFDCMVAGSVPVFFWQRTAYLQYHWFLPGEPESYSVFLNRNEVKNGTSINGILKKISKEKVREMREKVIEYIPKMVYANNDRGLEGMKDAFDLALEGMLRRVKEQEGGYKWKK